MERSPERGSPRAANSFLRFRRNDRGSAFTEFAICYPFIVIMLTALIDMAMAINQYMLLTQAVHSGVRMATSLSYLPNGRFENLVGNPNCSQTGSSPVHKAIQERVEQLVNMNGRNIDEDSLCISTGVVVPAGTPADNTVYVDVSIRYRGFFPAFRSLPLAVKASGPYLS